MVKTSIIMEQYHITFLHKTEEYWGVFFVITLCPFMEQLGL